ncbi:DUF5017 domain-containing protein [Pedobacter sp. KBS0701]|uniref:DUF5017 domain-containing protein n=1 Tax=unclassified Pedobacter TaxID=2628915 RepID=UPI00110D6AA6|nr:DUF5017 domain-containing protein [Pedobacter sp. KBS0701]QDW24846.1 DUF5017 domain-containing protein [Pedobacter sp. KBS0701]
MKTKYLTGKLAILLVLLFLGCKKETVDMPEFNATVNKTTFKLGDTVIFKLDGDPDFVSFYSGEYLNNYSFIGGRKIDIQSISLSFQSRVQNGNQANQLSVYLSSDFNGKFDMESIRAGNFKNVTDLVTLGSANAVYAPSGTLDLSTLVTDRTKPLYVAFRYVTKPQDAATGTQRTWTIRDLALNTVTELGKNAAIDQLTAAWTLVQSGPIIEPNRSSITQSNGQIVFRGNITNEGKLVETDFWAVSKAVDLNTIILGPDKSIPIKGISETLPSVYKYIYTKPGVYKAVFATSNNRINSKKELLKEIEITIVP